MRIGLLVVLLGLLAVPALAETPEDRATFGDCLSRDVATALTACTRLIESKPSEPAVLARALYYRGSAYDSKGDYPSAITDFTEFDPGQAAGARLWRTRLRPHARQRFQERHRRFR